MKRIIALIALLCCSSLCFASLSSLTGAWLEKESIFYGYKVKLYVDKPNDGQKSIEVRMKTFADGTKSKPRIKKLQFYSNNTYRIDNQLVGTWSVYKNYLTLERYPDRVTLHIFEKSQ